MFASVVPPEDGRLTPETCRGSRHNKVNVKVKVCYVAYVIVTLNKSCTLKWHFLLNAISGILYAKRFKKHM
jgi:hypothetical protein